MTNTHLRRIERKEAELFSRKNQRQMGIIVNEWLSDSTSTIPSESFPCLPVSIPGSERRHQPQTASVLRSPDAGSIKTASPRTVSPGTGSPTKDCFSSDPADASPSFFGQAQVSAVQEETPRGTIEQGIDQVECNVDAPPTSWSFAARQRCECARIARVFRYTRHRMRQELRGLALNHAELLLGGVTRIVAANGDGKATRRATDVYSPGRGAVEEGRNQDGSRPGNDGCELREEEGYRVQEEGEGGVGEKDVWRPACRMRGNLRHEARPHDAWDRRWAIAVDEENMGELYTLGLEGAMPEMGDRFEGWAGTGAGAGLLVEWRKAFRRVISLTAGIRHPARICASQRCGSSTYAVRSLLCQTPADNTVFTCDCSDPIPSSSCQT